MILSIIILLLVLLVAYFHYAQGLFSATISAVLVVTSAVFAVAYHETVAEKLLGGKMGDNGYGICLCLIFTVSYVVLRIIFDKAVPGNVSFPLMMDRLGGAVMGLVAGVFATGVFALAVQSLPFGPQVAGYSPYDLNAAQAVTIPTDQQYLDSTEYDAMKDASLDPAKAKGMLIPVTDVLLGTVQRLSDGGALAGDQPLSAVHPDYVREAFGTRLGVQVGAKHTALNGVGADQVKLGGLYALTALPAVDGELKELRGPDFQPPKIISATSSQLLLVVRLLIEASAADDVDHLFRFSPGSIRLVTNSKDYFPLGTVDSADLLMMAHPDDFLFLDLSSSSEQAVDVVFQVDKADLLGGSSTSPKVIDGAFVAVKRMARVDLSGSSIQGTYAASPEGKVLRKKAMAAQIQKTPPPQVAIRSTVDAPAAGPAALARRVSTGYGGAAVSATPVVTGAAASAAGGARDAGGGAGASAAAGTVTSTLGTKIGVNTSDDNAQDVSVAGGTVSLKDSRLFSANIEPTATTDKLATGDSSISELFVPEGKSLVQVTARAASVVPQLLDSTGASTPANGYYGLITTGSGKSAFLHYYADRPVSGVAAPPSAASVTYLFVVPSGVTATQLSINGSTLSVTVTGR